jgi:hypothetical protein
MENPPQQELFSYLSNELGVIALQTQMYDIERICNKDMYSKEFMFKFLLWVSLKGYRRYSNEWRNGLFSVEVKTNDELLELFIKDYETRRI